MRVRVGGPIFDARKVEDHEIRIHALADHATVQLSDLLHRHRGHASDGLLQRKDALVPDVPGEHARKASIAPRMGKANPIAHRVPIGLEHGPGVLHDPDDVLLIHGMVDGAEATFSLQFDHELNARIERQREASIRGQIGQGSTIVDGVTRKDSKLDPSQVTTAALLEQDTPDIAPNLVKYHGIFHARPKRLGAPGKGPLGEQHGRARAGRRVGIDVMLDVEPLGSGRINHGERLLTQPPLPCTDGLVVVNLGGEPGLAGDPDKFLHRVQEARGFIAQVRHIKSTVARGHPGKRDHLFGFGIIGRHIDQPGG